MIEFVASSPAVAYAAPAPMSEYVAPTPTVCDAAPAPVDEYVAPAPAEVVYTPALHAADLTIHGLGEGDPEYEAAADLCIALRGYHCAG